MLKRHFFILIALVLTGSGCVSSAVVKKKIDWNQKPVCLSACDQIPAVIEKYKETHDLVTGDNEIDYLLDRIRFSDSTFIRNGEEIDPSGAAQFLRQKIVWFEKRHGKKIDNGEKFVSWVTKGSEASGKPYTVVLPDESKHNLRFIMQNELDRFKTYQGKTPKAPLPSNKTTP